MFANVLEEPQAASVGENKRPTILIIDDDEALAEILSRALERQQFVTIAEESGKSGLATARSRHPDLILLDLGLPDIDGLALCEQLADSSETCGIPVIILSGMERADILRCCRAAGCSYFLRKPYDPNALLVLIQHALRETGDWNAWDAD